MTLDIEALFNAPPAKFRGMVDNRVREEDFECDPDRPNPASCPSSGCKHCIPISMAADPPGAIVDTEEGWQQLSLF